MPKIKKHETDRPSGAALRKEVKCLGLIGLGILLLLSIFMADNLGFVGPFFRNLSLGIFGLGGVFLPFAVICYAVLRLINRELDFPLWRSLFLLLVVLAWLYIVVDPIGEHSYSAGEYLRAVYARRHMASGGLVGALFGGVVRAFAARIGAIIILSIVALGLLINITNRSFFKLVESGARRARDMYDEHRARRVEEDEEDARRAAAMASSAPKALKPLPEKKKKVSTSPVHTAEYAELIDIDPHDHSMDDDYKVLLVDEEMDSTIIETEPRELAPFLRVGKKGKDPKITHHVASPRAKTNMHMGEMYAEDSHATHETREPVAVKQPATPARTAPAREEIFVDYVYDDDGDDGEPQAISGRIMPDVSDEETHAPPADFVVRGLVDDAAPSKPPVFEYDDFDEPDPVVKRAPATPPVEAASHEPTYDDFRLPSIELLARNERAGASAESRAQVMQRIEILEETLRSFRVDAKVVEAIVGPTVTRYELVPGPGVKVSAITNLSNDLALSLAAQGIRIEAPIPGKSAVGIEIPNKEPQGVFLREILENEHFEKFSSKLAFAVGKDIAGSAVVADVADMPHLLIAGATGAGKSVCINTLIASLLYKAKPDEVKLLMIDPKVVELSVYNGIPHLLIPVVTDPKKASGALNWAVQEMESRYGAFAETGCRDLKGYNRYLLEKGDGETRPLPQIVIIIDELADLMMTAKGEVEEAICRIAQKARAAGIHLIVATQRPSVDVITGLIKANIPSRLAFAVSSGTDSRTVLDMQGAEKLLGRGDMLFLPRGQNKPIRVQGGFISDKEVENLVAFLKAQAPATHSTEMIQQITMPGKAKVEGEVDEFFHDAVEFLLVKGKASTSMLQRQFRIGYNRASRLMEELETRGIVGSEDGVKPRKVTITRDEYREIYGDDV